MQQIVNVTIDSKGNAIPDSKSIGLQYETGVTKYAITPDPSWVSDQYFYYMIVSPPEDSDNKQYAVPLVNQGGTFIFEISSGITWHVGNYKFAFLTMSKELVDGQVSKDGIVSISESWNGKITKSILDYIALQKQPVDANFQLLYTDLMALSVEVRKQINYAQEQGDYAQEQGNYAKTKTDELITQAQYAQEQGNYAKGQGDNAKAQGNKAQEQGIYAEEQGDYAKKTAEQILQDKENGVFKGDKGDKGDKGEDGLTPYIGENNNWWVGGTDTGVSGSGIVLKASEDNIIDFNTITKAGMYFIENVTRDTALNVPGMFSFVYPSTIPVLVVDRGGSNNGHIITQISAINSGMDYIYTRRMIKNENGSVGAFAWERLDSNINNQIYELSNTVTAKEQALQGQIDRLRANQIQGSASGTEVVVQDAAEMESVLRVSGNSEQDSRSGKNILPQENFATAQTINGVTFTPNADGSVKINGTATASTNLYLTYKLLDKLITGKTYISSIGETGAGLRLIVEEAKGGSWVASISNNQNAPWAFNGLTTGDKVRVAINVPNGTTVSTTIYPQIEEGSTATSYEPYGVQPSPDYPSEIRSAKSKSDNVIDLANVSTYSSGATGVIQDNKLIVTNSGKGGYSSYWLFIPVSPNTTYTVSIGEMIGNIAPATRVAKNGEGESKYIIGMLYPNSNSLTFTTDVETTRIGLFFYPNYESATTEAGATATFGKIQLVKGDKALPYQPYGYVPVEVKVEGKNKLKNTATSQVVNGVTFTVNEDKSITVKGIATATAILSITKSCQLEIGKTYTLRGTSANAGHSDFIIQSLDYKEYYTAVENRVTFTPKEHTDFEIVLRVYKDVNVDMIVYPQINEGSTVAEYVPYVEPITVQLPLGDIVLRSTPDGTRDTFTRVDGVWNKEEKISCYKPILSRLREYTKLNYLQFEKHVNDINRLNSSKGYAMCNIATYKNDWIGNYDDENLINKLIVADTTIYFIGVSKDVDTTEKAQQLIDNTIVYFQIKTPTYTPITDQALIQALDELEQLILHKGYNYITATSVNGVKAQLDLSYIKDINAVLDNLTAAILTLGGELNV